MSFAKRNRQKEIIQILQREKEISAVFLVEHFDVSAATIRRDLEQMDRQGLLKKTHGGAEVVEKNSGFPSLNVRRTIYPEVKVSVAAVALQYIQNGYTVALDSGSTASELCRLLSARSNLKIICSDIHNAEIALSSGNRVYMMGGNLTPDGTSDGNLADEFLSGIGRLDLFVTSTDGADLQDGLYTNEVGINELKRRYLRKAAVTVLMADHSKFARKGFHKLCGFEDVDIVITDSGTPPEIIDGLRAKGLEVVVTGL